MIINYKNQLSNSKSDVEVTKKSISIKQDAIEKLVLYYETDEQGQLKILE